MKQIVFVLKNGQVGYWKYQRGRLVHASLDGNPWNDFTPDFWDKWKLANQVSDGVDAILLADAKDSWGKLPAWLKLNKKRTSAWTVETLLLLREDAEIESDVTAFFPNLQSSLALPEKFEEQLAGSDAQSENTTGVTEVDEDELLQSRNSLIQVLKIANERDAAKPLTATVRIEESLQKAKPGEVFEGVVSSYSRFNGCWLSVAGENADCRVQIKKAEVEKVTDPVKYFAVGKKFDLTGYEANFSKSQVLLTVTPASK